MSALTAAEASAIYDVLVEMAGAPERQRDSFVHSQTNDHIDEWRFQGLLGFGGKFWRLHGPRKSDGTWGERWSVNCYGEDETAERREYIRRTNAALDALQAEALR